MARRSGMPPDTPDWSQLGLLSPSELTQLGSERLSERARMRREMEARSGEIRVKNPGQLGDRLRWLRGERTYREMATMTPGVSHQRIAQLEQEARPNPSLSVLLALQVGHGLNSVDELLGPLFASHLLRAYLDVPNLPGS